MQGNPGPPGSTGSQGSQGVTVSVLSLPPSLYLSPSLFISHLYMCFFFNRVSKEEEERKVIQDQKAAGDPLVVVEKRETMARREIR